MPTAAPALARRAEILVARTNLAAFEAVLEPLASALAIALESAAEERCRLRAYAIDDAALAAIDRAIAETAASLGIAPPAVAIETIAEVGAEVGAEVDWAARMARDFPPIEAGRYFVHGGHITALPGRRVALRIEAGAAFGTGEHESTRGCLLALDGLARRRPIRRALDMGTGSGILAVAMAKTWPARVIAADNDHDAVAAAREAARRNEVAARLRACHGDGFHALLVRASAPFDLICANIRARPLVGLAPALRRHLAAPGIAVLSGLLAKQEPWVLGAYRAQGLRLARRIALGDWRTLVLSG
jgi:ribosomal protein L11 methyltransferase